MCLVDFDVFLLFVICYGGVEPYEEWSLKYGYLDSKPAWYGTGIASGEIHLKITIGSVPYVWVCGLKESLKHATVYLDVNVKTPLNGNWTLYTPPAAESRVLWDKKKYQGNECKQIHDLPSGVHVLSIGTTKDVPLHETTISHVITWQ